MAIRTGSPTVAALHEDRRAAWAPDPLGWVDAAALLEAPVKPDQMRPIEFVPFPKPDGSTLTAPILDLPTLGRLHRVVGPLRDAIDTALSPGVCGYRRGAEPELSYSRENARFHEVALAEAEHANFVAFADVRTFFSRATWDLVIAHAARIAGNSAVDGLTNFAAIAGRAGLQVLPAGYADARLLANGLLAASDCAIGAPFVRWVDDYRIFAASREDAAAALGRLRSALSSDGLELNTSKVSIAPAASLAARRGGSLESVYHPDIEGSRQVRAALRTVFADAALDPVKNRRKIRFALPRLAEQGDDFGVAWALASLPDLPWEAPRICGYLATFAARPEVAAPVEEQLVTALLTGSRWLALRLAALTCHTGLSRGAADVVVTALKEVTSPALWSLLLRSLATSHFPGHVEEVVDRGVLDPRAAMAALIDVDRPVARSVLDSVPHPTVEQLRNGPAPLPDMDSIL